MQTFTLAWQVEGHQHTYTVTAGRRCLIGRQATACDIVLQPSMISRQHAIIDMMNDTFYLWNLSGTNRICFNEQTHLTQHQSMPLKPGDIFRIGPITFEVQAAAKPTVRIYKLRCAHCDRIVDYTPEAFCPWCGRALSNGESIILEQ